MSAFSAEAFRRIQEEGARRVMEIPLQEEIHLLAGVDVSYHRPTRRMVGGIVVMRWPTLEVVETVVAVRVVEVPYVPGFLSFRELPVLLEALEKLKHTPDLFLVDGQGRWHPRRFGLASHFGVEVDRPTIGVAKSPLLPPQALPGEQRGEVVFESLGAVVRTRTGVRPLYVSVGHRITLQEAVAWVLRTARRYRLPEPIRYADRMTREQARKLSEETL